MGTARDRRGGSRWAARPGPQDRTGEGGLSARLPGPPDHAAGNLGGEGNPGVARCKQGWPAQWSAPFDYVASCGFFLGTNGLRLPGRSLSAIDGSMPKYPPIGGLSPLPCQSGDASMARNKSAREYSCLPINFRGLKP